MISIYTNVADAIISVDGNFIINAKNETNTFRVGGGDNLITIRRDADKIAAGSDANFISARGGADTIVGSHFIWCRTVMNKRHGVGLVKKLTLKLTIA
jgi:hypothetical protein